jgi:heat-inducible transcriptional repressor
MESRREAILEAVVREYIETGVPVGSLVLVQKYQFPFSTATIRAEMAELERHGFLTHPHTSAGRMPTEKGYRYFVNMMSAEEGLLAREEHAARKRLEAMRGRYERRLETASEVLADLTRNMGFAGLPGEIFSHGLGNLFSQPEFLNPERILKTAELLDNLATLIFEAPTNIGTRIYIGSESPIGKSAECSIILSEFVSPFGDQGYLGIIGPMRMSYGRNLAAINEVKGVLEDKNV